MREISQELQETVKQNPHIDNVHFDGSGNHYFNVHELIESKGDTKTKLYGRGVHSHKQVIPGSTNVDKIQEDIAKGQPDSEIVETLSRADVLGAKVKPTGDTLIAKLAQATPEELEAVKAMLGITTATPEAKEAKKAK